MAVRTSMAASVPSQQKPQAPSMDDPWSINFVVIIHGASAGTADL
jgi:hypothetical protein